MTKLDADGRFAIMMHRALGFSEKEIADALKVDQSTVSYHVSKLRMEAVAEGSAEKVFMRTMARSPDGVRMVLSWMQLGFMMQAERRRQYRVAQLASLQEVPV